MTVAKFASYPTWLLWWLPWCFCFGAGPPVRVIGIRLLPASPVLLYIWHPGELLSTRAAHCLLCLRTETLLVIFPQLTGHKCTKAEIQDYKTVENSTAISTKPWVLRWPFFTGVSWGPWEREPWWPLCVACFHIVWYRLGRNTRSTSRGHQRHFLFGSFPPTKLNTMLSDQEMHLYGPAHSMHRIRGWFRRIKCHPISLWITVASVRLKTQRHVHKSCSLVHAIAPREEVTRLFL